MLKMKKALRNTKRLKKQTDEERKKAFVDNYKRLASVDNSCDAISPNLPDTYHEEISKLNNYIQMLSEADIKDINLPKLPNKIIEKFSKYDVITEIILRIELVQNENNSIEQRIEQAFVIGRLLKTAEVLHVFGVSQQKIAEQPRKKGLPEIFDSLRAKKNLGFNPKELWPDFVNMLHKEKESFDQVTEYTGNSHNLKTWSVSYVTVPDSDKIKSKDDSMTYERFRRRLSENKGG